MSWGAAISGLVAIVAAIMGFLKYKRVAREKLAQAEVDELARGMRAVDDSDKLREPRKD